MAIDRNLQIKAYELLIANLSDEIQKCHQRSDDNMLREVDRLSITSDFIFRELGFKKLFELAEIIDKHEGDGGSMVDYVESNYSE